MVSIAIEMVVLNIMNFMCETADEDVCSFVLLVFCVGNGNSLVDG